MLCLIVSSRTAFATKKNLKLLQAFESFKQSKSKPDGQGWRNIMKYHEISCFLINISEIWRDHLLPSSLESNSLPGSKPKPVRSNEPGKDPGGQAMSSLIDSWGRPHHNSFRVRCQQLESYGYGSIPINTIFSGMNIHLPAILMFTRGTRFWHTAILDVIGVRCCEPLEIPGTCLTCANWVETAPGGRHYGPLAQRQGASRGNTTCQTPLPF